MVTLFIKRLSIERGRKMPGGSHSVGKFYNSCQEANSFNQRQILHGLSTFPVLLWEKIKDLRLFHLRFTKISLSLSINYENTQVDM